jgi:hypothetical protein
VDALVLLTLDRSTNVVLKLRRVGHPLAQMDYMSIYEADENDHPTLRTPPGTREQHRRHFKEVIKYHLAQRVLEAEALDH